MTAFNTRTDLDAAITAWIEDEVSATEKYGDINNWDVSGITNLSELFRVINFFD